MKIIYSAIDMSFEKALQILGLTEETLNEENLKKNYRALMMKHHSDVNNSSDSFASQINIARDVLESGVKKSLAPKVDTSKFDMNIVKEKIKEYCSKLGPVNDFIFYCFDGNNFKDILITSANMQGIEESSKLFQIACKNYQAAILVKDPKSRSLFLVRKKGIFVSPNPVFSLKSGTDPLKDMDIISQIKKYLAS